MLDGDLQGFSISGDGSPDSHCWTVTASLLADVVPYLIGGKASLELSQLSVKKAKSHFPRPNYWSLLLHRSRQSIELLRGGMP